MTKTCSTLLIFLGLSACTPSTGDTGVPRLELPKALKEISGLALSPNGDLLAVADEQAAVYSVNFNEARAEVLTRFGKPAVKGDFEGITLHNGLLYLLRSDGLLLRRPLAADGHDYETFDTELRDVCELEGMTTAADTLLLLCKTPYRKGERKHLLIYAWSVAGGQLLEKPWFAARYRDLGLPRLHPSGISMTADGGAALIVAAREQRYAIVSAGGQLLQDGPLPNPHAHPQTEGVVVTPANTLYLADEGHKGRGSITRYERFF